MKNASLCERFGIDPQNAWTLRMKFSKPALTFSGQVKLLASRGLVIDDLEQAARFLTQVNYYRLTGYILPFEADRATHPYARNQTNAID